jgi:polyketide cyclase/dehydrase/lipid transport protein
VGDAMDHEHTEHIAAAPDAVYAAISDVRNLPRFVPQITGAREAGGDRVEVDARYHGEERHGEAALRTDDERRRVEWETPSGYRGWMQVDPDGGNSRLTLFLSTRHGAEHDHDVASTLDAIRMLVESQV